MNFKTPEDKEQFERNLFVYGSAFCTQDGVTIPNDQVYITRMTFNEAMDKWENLRSTPGGEWVLKEMKLRDLTTKTDEGKRVFTNLVEQACGQLYGWPFH